MSSATSITTKAVDGVLWKLTQNLSTTLINFVLQIWLARLLLPEHYGIIALTSVFITISLVFVKTGFSASLVQKSTLSDIEINSVFYIGIFCAFVLYSIVFFFAPVLASFYSEPLLSKILRIQSLNIIIASLYSVPVALIQRNLEFKKTFLAGLISSIFQGSLGVMLAYLGYGVWALIISSMTYSLIYLLTIILVTRWRPKVLFSLSAVQNLFAFSSKILLNQLINTLVNNLKSLIIGRVYNSELLGYYNRGYQIPALITTNVDGAISAVAFPTFSYFQNDYEILVLKLRKALQLSIYFVWPIMVGLAITSKPLIIILLTEKWLLCVPFLIMSSVICMSWPFSIFSHAINAVGRSDLSLKLNIISTSTALLGMAISYRFGIYIFVGSTIISSFVTANIALIMASRLLEFKYLDIVYDCFPTFFVSMIMGGKYSPCIFFYSFSTDSIGCSNIIRG